MEKLKKTESSQSVSQCICTKNQLTFIEEIHFKIGICRYGVELLELERVTVECIQETLETIKETNGKSFNPRNMIHLLIENIMAILVIYIVHI